MGSKFHYFSVGKHQYKIVEDSHEFIAYFLKKDYLLQMGSNVIVITQVYLDKFRSLEDAMTCIVSHDFKLCIECPF